MFLGLQYIVCFSTCKCKTTWTAIGFRGRIRILKWSTTTTALSSLSKNSFWVFFIFKFKYISSYTGAHTYNTRVCFEHFNECILNRNDSIRLVEKKKPAVSSRVCIIGTSVGMVDDYPIDCTTSEIYVSPKFILSVLLSFWPSSSISF